MDIQLSSLAGVVCTKLLSMLSDVWLQVQYRVFSGGKIRRILHWGYRKVFSQGKFQENLKVGYFYSGFSPDKNNNETL